MEAQVNIEKALEFAGMTSNGCTEAEHRFIYQCVMDVPEEWTGRGLVIEIGSWLGGLATTLAAACEERGFDLMCVDTWHLGCLPGAPNDIGRHPLEDGKPRGWLFEQHTEQLIRAGLRQHVMQIVTDSLMFKKYVPQKDVVFVWIDGCHDHHHATQEFQAYAANIVMGGIVGWHDAPEIADAIELCCVDKSANWREITPMPLMTICPVTPGVRIDKTGPWLTRAFRRVDG
jgi:hypothetical protein